jgi:LytS/YehU family sensor histidine kinase
MIQQLSDFLRGTLKKDNNQLVSLDDELNHLQLYLDIEMVRFGHRLKTKVLCNDECRQMKLPAMLLQPVVENAIKFGLYNTTEEVVITVQAQCATNQLKIDITNPFDPSATPQKKGTGFGLKSVERRLVLLFAQHGLLRTSINQNLFTTSITIPQTV